jgi:peroxiredoxin
MAAVIAMVCAAGFQQAEKPVKAPDFSAKGSDGKTHTLKSLTAGKTLVLYFIGSTCPVNDEAVRYYKQVADAYKGKVNFIGVVDGDAAILKDWQKSHNVKFPVLFDPDLKIIRSYQAFASPWIVVVGPNGEVSKRQSGYSGPTLTELNALMAKSAGVTAAKLDFKGAPAEETFG